MRILITAREANERLNWSAFCDVVGLSYYAMREGMDGDREFALDESQAYKLGLTIQDKPESE